MAIIRTSRAEWLDRVRGWIASGLSCREYASSSGINPRTLSWWRWKLIQDGEDLPSSRRKPEQALPAKFVELEFPQSTKRELEELPSLPIELVVGEAVVRVQVGFEESCLERVLDVLEARR